MKRLYVDKKETPPKNGGVGPAGLTLGMLYERDNDPAHTRVNSGNNGYSLLDSHHSITETVAICNNNE